MRIMRKSLIAEMTLLSAVLAVLLTGCHEGGKDRIYTVAGGCYAVAALDPERPWAERPTTLGLDDAGTGYTFDPEQVAGAMPFFLKASGLGAYLFYDDAGSYLVSDGVSLDRADRLRSDIELLDDSFQSPGEWELEAPRSVDVRFHVRHRASGRYLATHGLVDGAEQAADIVLLDREGCADFPELSVDATGDVEVTEFDDGSLFGFVDTHSHILSNFAFGGGGLFHGAPFHALGVEHALADCSQFHGEEGRQDLFGFGFDNRGVATDLLFALINKETPTDNHKTSGYPEFTDWPSAPFSSTHQTQYYTWLERAYLSGLRLVVQHATTNQIICDVIKGAGIQDTRYSCNDMVAVDRILEETRAMEAYIDAQSGGPGKGFFRVVTTPEDAREVIADGKMAVVLGIETSNLFDCLLTPPAGMARCTEQDVLDKLDDYHARGVRAIFPVHKYDNGFSAGDGNKDIIELGNFIMTGHPSNFTTDCDSSIPTVFDKGPSSFPALIGPRQDYFAVPPYDLSGVATDPVGTLIPFVELLATPPNGEEVCQNAGLTSLGEFLMYELMQRGMIIEIDHMPRRSYETAFGMLEQNDYPAAGTHGINNGGRLYALGGVSKTGFSTCRSETESATVDDGFQNRIALIEDNGGFPAEGFGFDLNGFAGGPGPRFGPRSGCSQPQDDPVTYPFTSYAGDVVFTEPRLGDRAVDFNTEGMSHIGLVAELIDDVRRDGVTDAELEPLFRSAEGYIRMWEKAERRGAELRGDALPEDEPDDDRWGWEDFFHGLFSAWFGGLHGGEHG